MESGEIFKLLMDASKTTQAVYLNNFWATMGAYLVAFGWLLTSIEARNFLQNNNAIRVISKITVILIFIVHVSVLFNAWYESVGFIQQMEGLKLKVDNISINSLARLHEIPVYWPFISSVINGAIVFLLAKQIDSLRVIPNDGITRQSR